MVVTAFGSRSTGHPRSTGTAGHRRAAAGRRASRAFPAGPSSAGTAARRRRSPSSRRQRSWRGVARRRSLVGGGRVVVVVDSPAARSSGDRGDRRGAVAVRRRRRSAVGRAACPRWRSGAGRRRWRTVGAPERRRHACQRTGWPGPPWCTGQRWCWSCSSVAVPASARRAVGACRRVGGGVGGVGGRVVVGHRGRRRRAVGRGRRLGQSGAGARQRRARRTAGFRSAVRRTAGARVVACWLVAPCGPHPTWRSCERWLAVGWEFAGSPCEHAGGARGGAAGDGGGVAVATPSAVGEEVGRIGPRPVRAASASPTTTTRPWPTKLADKLWHLRVFDDDAGVMNRSVADVGAELLVVSQFTLYGDTSGGRRPSWIAAARPEHAEPLVDAVVAELRRLGATVATGRFRTEMQVSSSTTARSRSCSNADGDRGRRADGGRVRRRSATAQRPRASRPRRTAASPSVTYHVRPARSSTAWRMTACSLTPVRSMHVAVGRDERARSRSAPPAPPSARSRSRAAGSTRPAGSARSCRCSSRRSSG